MPQPSQSDVHSEEDPVYETTPEAVAEALSHLEVANIFPTEISASIDGPPAPIDFVETDVDIDYLAQEGVFSNRFAWTVRMLHDFSQGRDREEGVESDGDSDLIASFSFTFQVDYATDEGYRVHDAEAVAITRTTGLFAAYPYARELLQNLTGRLQLDPIVLGMLMRGEIRPAGVTKVDRDGAS
jgi:hypothetical protein